MDIALARRGVDDAGPSVLFIDVDDFKTVNDGYGHAAGDQLLIEIGRRLQRCTRPEDVVARLGGDEFAILVAGDATHPATATVIAHRVLTSMKKPFVVVGHEVFADVSIGIAGEERGPVDAAQLLRHADLAMYKAKAQGKGRCAAFSEALDDDVRRRIEMETGLRAAIDCRDIVVHYQPIVTMSDARIVGLEALVRWNHPVRGLLPPVEFLPTAEATGLIIPIGRVVLNEACRQLREWQDSDARNARLTMSINLSARQLCGESLIADLDSAVARAGIDTRTLIIEVTENVLFADIEGIASTLEKIRHRGILIAMDDFGTGYSSLSHLARFTVDQVKVDRSFVDAVCDGGSGSTVVHGVLNLARDLRLLTIAEGVEDTSQALELRRLGCDLAQGYLYSRACDPETISRFLSVAHLDSHREATALALA